MSVKKVKADYTFVQIPPEYMIADPEYWDPRMAYQIAHYAAQGVVGLIDWHFWRWPKNQILRDIMQYDGKIVLWGPWHSYLRLKWVYDQLEKDDFDVTTMGFPRALAKNMGLKTEKWIGEKTIRQLPTPHLSLFERPGYWTFSRLPYTGDTAEWTQRIPMQFRFDRGAVKPRKAAEMFRELKIQWWFDSVSWLDDLTEDVMGWTRHVFDELEKMKISFQYMCKGKYDSLTARYAVLLHETGCKVLDFGRHNVSNLQLESFRTRFRGALQACIQNDIKPLWLWVIDDKATLEDCRNAVDFIVSYDNKHRPDVTKNYLEASEEELREMVVDLWNPTQFSDFELWGIRDAMQKGWVKPFLP